MIEADRGIILAGGQGTRLRPATGLYNKHIALVYDRPMISYPLQTLKGMGYDKATIVSTPSGVGEISRYVQDGESFGIDVEYKVTVQDTAPTTLARVPLEGVFPMLLGDCYYDPGLPRQTEPTLFWHLYETAHNHSVWSPEADAIIEKPKFVNLGNKAIVAYFYDERVFDFIEREHPTEIVDLHNFYRREGAQMLKYDGFFGDMGTPEGLLRVANHEAAK